MISLLKIVDGPWEKVRGYIKLDLEHIQAAVNQRWNATFGDDNTLKSTAITIETIESLGLPSIAETAARVSLRV